MGRSIRRPAAAKRQAHPEPQHARQPKGRVEIQERTCYGKANSTAGRVNGPLPKEKFAASGSDTSYWSK